MKIGKFLTALVLFASIMSCTITTPGTATSNPVGSKTGEATGSFIFGIPMGTNLDMGIQKAALNGGISTVSTVDVKYTWLVVLTKVTTVVTGE
ncbi:TRL domain-containing protein [Spirochaeta cellobiosiphila]|uniref:TRL domain-containing protein n=1 Tax=Spirochaeta cellobiosiphila TaxID=504483 RepID=UPI00041C927D|nr:TRL domain-containing protein [Spirochaeta cellobiosiphila]